ncbi:SycD/LcrH family type III secretion system chaperone [Pseudothauera rhizosphaerae]|uniref:CesD/SycD/LcrH family type III secretion system chaperone n=1 Tax=Pseudothauera rhizosphaerae TaxID=2565932 RepID=A0A4V3W9Z9_9RHOO|nr:SycD/LcrH family type III secretion system chaperone [Pseudothauera rhizosphaerae]THF57279.1 CesD/SycD/LcrH family type III secretion system chaperone [Pseudothauera rhizosphaerae]
MSQTTPRDLSGDIAEVVDFVADGGTLAQVLHIDAKEMEAVYAMAYGYYRQARWQEALKAFTFLVAHDQWEKRYLVGRAACLQMLKQYDAALKAYGLAYVLDATDVDVLLHMAECLIGQGKKEEALGLLESVGELAEGKPQFTGQALRAKAMAALLVS